MKFGPEKKKFRFPYWVLPTVIFVFGVGMFVGRALDSELTLMEFRNQKLTVADVIDKLWPRDKDTADALPARTVSQRTEVENRLKTENAHLMTEKDALVQKVHAMRSELQVRDQSIKSLRDEINKLARANQQLVELNKENEKFKRQVALERAARQKNKASRQASGRPAAERGAPPTAKEKSPPAAAARSELEAQKGPSYQVLRRTPILRNPAENAQILYYLNPGRRVQVSGIVDGRFMRVRYSRSGNPPGYVLLRDVVPLQ